MDHVYFLKQRTAFIRMLYREAHASFAKKMKQIEAGEPPFEPPYSEDDEPPYLTEYIEANDASLVLGEACISMLSASLKLFLVERLRFVIEVTDEGRKTLKRLGILRGYCQMFAAVGLPIDHAPVNYPLLEEIDLARNAAQHPARLTSLNATYPAHSLKRMPSPIFISESQRELLHRMGDAGDQWLLDPSIEVTPDKMEQAILEVEHFCEWFDAWLIEHETALRAAAKDGTPSGR